MSEKILYILRHAKTESLVSGQKDHERPLTEQGLSESADLGKYLLAEGISPQQVWCSSATRTRQTWQHAQAVYGKTVPVYYDDAFYNINLAHILKKLEEVPEDTKNLLWVGHNPGVHELCDHLSQSGDSNLRNHLAYKFPPGSFVEIRFEGVWKDIDSCSGCLKRFAMPDRS